MALRLSGRKRKAISHWKEQCRECQICGAVPKSLRNLEAHHIVSRKDGGRENRENLIFLCAGCHFVVHRDEWYAYLVKKGMG